MTQDRYLLQIANHVCTPKQLDAVKLVWTGRFTSRQAAIILGISHGALQDRLRNARRRIAESLNRKAA